MCLVSTLRKCCVLLVKIFTSVQNIRVGAMLHLVEVMWDARIVVEVPEYFTKVPKQRKQKLKLRTVPKKFIVSNTFGANLHTTSIMLS